MIAFLFGGQGADPPWVTDDILDDPEVASLVAVAGEATGLDVARLLARGGRELTRTEILQPAMVAVCLGIVRILARAGVRPEIVAGHSLGELAAWAAAGGITAEDAVALAATRGRLMAREAARRPGGMVRIKGDRETCDRALASAAAEGWICLAAHNAPDEWIASGDAGAVAQVVAHYPSVRLPVAGAWHSPAMAGAVAELAEATARLRRSPIAIPLVTNRDGTLATDEGIVGTIVEQLIRPVAWVACLDTLVAAGVRRSISIGPGKMLRALVRRNLGTEIEIVDSMATAGRAREMA